MLNTRSKKRNRTIVSPTIVDSSSKRAAKGNQQVSEDTGSEACHHQESECESVNEVKSDNEKDFNPDGEDNEDEDEFEPARKTKKNGQTNRKTPAAFDLNNVQVGLDQVIKFIKQLTRQTRR